MKSKFSYLSDKDLMSTEGGTVIPIGLRIPYPVTVGAVGIWVYNNFKK